MDRAPELEKTPVVKFDPPEPVYRANENNDVFPEQLIRWDQLFPGVRVGIKSPWEKFEYLCGVIRGRPGSLVLQVGASFGALEHIEGTGWVCTGLVPQQNIMSELGQKKAAETRKSYTDKLVTRTAKGSTSSTPAK